MRRKNEKGFELWEIVCIICLIFAAGFALPI